MGLFSSKKKYVVNVTVQKVFEEAQIPNSVQTGVIKYILDDITSVSDSLLEELTAGVGAKANIGYGWAKRNDYSMGIPEATVKSNVDAKTAVLNAIMSNIGQTITPVYYRFGPMNSLHFGWVTLVNSYGYNPTTNEITGLTASTGFPCYLSDMRATYTRESYDFIMATYDAGVLDQLGPSPQSGYTPRYPYTKTGNLQIGGYAAQPDYEISDVAVDDYITITYQFVDGAGVIQERGITVSITGISDSDYHQVRYTKPDGSTGFFTYLGGSGTYPGIDSVFIIGFDDVGTFYPWTYFRVQGQPVDDDTFPDYYADGKKWCNYIGVDFDTVYNGVHEDTDVEDVEQCILQLAVHPDSQNPSVLQYLFKHFTVMHESSISQEDIGQTLTDKMLAFSSSPSQIQIIKDKLFTQTLQYSGITRKRVAGKIGKVGTYTGEYGYVAQDQQNFVEIKPTGVSTSTTWTSQPAYVYRYQVMDSMYEELAVYGLRIDYQVHSKKGFGAGGKEPELLIPLDRAIMRTIPIGAREQIICRGMHMLVNTVVVVKTPWYASPLFKAILIIIAVVITILSLGQAWQTIVAAAAIGTAAVITVISVMVLQYLAVAYAVKLFVKKFGPKVGAIAAIAAIAIGGYNYAAGGSSMWGESLISVGNNLAAESQSAYSALLEDAILEIEDYTAWAQGQFDSLEEKRDELGLNPSLLGYSVLDLERMVPYVNLGESPDSFFARTVHSGNIGATSYDLIESYCALKLTLPTLNETQELFDYGYTDGPV